MRAIIFDLDGTLFQTEKVGVPAFRETICALQEDGWSGKVPTDKEIQSVFGMTHEEIWQVLLPGADEEMKRKADEMMLAKELELLKLGKGALFPEVEETLGQLKERGYNLFIASNGCGPYVRGALDSKNLTSLFTDIYTAGDYETKTKVELVKICKKEHGITSGYMVGDRSSDVKAGKENELIVIGCRYAEFPQFGNEDELAEADTIIDSFAELLQVIQE